MGFGTQVRHGVGSKRDVEPQLAGMAGRRFYAEAGGDADDHHLRDARRLEVGIKVASSCRPICHGQTKAAKLTRPSRGLHDAGVASCRLLLTILADGLLRQP